MVKGGKGKGKTIVAEDRNRFNMKVVTSDVCEKCMKCERGIEYVRRMSLPGAVGFGVPCILTKGKGYK